MTTDAVSAASLAAMHSLVGPSLAGVSLWVPGATVPAVAGEPRGS